METFGILRQSQSIFKAPKIIPMPNFIKNIISGWFVMNLGREWFQEFVLHQIFPNKKCIGSRNDSFILRLSASITSSSVDNFELSNSLRAL